jgi:hypothetical protein
MNNLADRWEHALAPDKPCARALRAEISVAPFDPDGAMTVQEYTERGRQLWAFRCWGAETCDGWLGLGLGHHTQTSALLERERHAVEEHGEPVADGQRAEAAVLRVRALADRIRQGAPWTASDDDIADHILAALNGDQTPAEPPVHIGGRANAEDCPACTGTNPPYPFICPGGDGTATECKPEAATLNSAPPNASRVEPDDLREQLHAAIESEVYEYRERSMWWPETGGVTQEIARLATRGAMSVLGRQEQQP